MLARKDRAPLSAQTAVSVILFCALAALACIAALAWVLLQYPDAPAAAPLATSCALVVPALPARNPLRRWWLRWLMWCNTMRMAETERQIAQYRRLLADDKLKLDSLRDQLSAQQTRQLMLASEQ